MEYDEDRELTRYVWTYYAGYATHFEQCVGRGVFIQEKLALNRPSAEVEAIAVKWAERDGIDATAALADGPEAFRRRVRDRILTEHAPDVFVNRCPRCARVVRTPQAQQCFWCGFDWHEPEPEPRLGS